MKQLSVFEQKLIFSALGLKGKQNDGQTCIIVIYSVEVGDYCLKGQNMKGFLPEAELKL